MAPLDRATARALTDAGYLPLVVYLEMFGTDAPSIVPKATDDPHDCSELSKPASESPPRIRVP